MKTITVLACVALIGCAGDEPDDGRILIERLLVVAPDELSECAELVAREHFDIGAEAATLSEIHEGQASAGDIDEFIESYEGGRGDLALILIGIHQILPGHDVMVANLNETTWTDRPYAELPDGRTVPTGRIPVADDWECAAYLDRPAGTGGADRNAIVFFGNEPEISYAYLYHAGYAREMGFEPTVLISPNADDLATAFVGGNVLAAFYYGHGSYRANGALTADNAEEILPEGILYFTGGCGFGQAEPEDGSIAEAIANRLGGAAVGASDFGGFGYEYQFVPGALRQLGTAKTVGEMQLRALEDYGKIELPAERVDTLEDRLVLYGDPTRSF